MSGNDTVLVVDDEAGIRKTLSGVLEDEGYRVLTAASGPEALTRIATETIHLLLLDIWMEEMDGLAVLEEVQQRHPETPVIMMSGHGTIDTAVAAIKKGAYDYLEKPLSLERVTLTVDHALSESRLRQENRSLKARIDHRLQMVGTSAPMQKLRAQIGQLAANCPRVLISGENGSGKELVARGLHTSSARAQMPFVEINCAALPEHLIESELFGYEKGAFSGAEKAKPGLFEQAHRGTLFLDEVGDMALATQARVLRALQEGRFHRLGGTRPREVDVWVIAATNRDLTAEVAAGNFREDLYYRLCVVPIQVPALRQRTDDIPLLIDYFVDNAVQVQGLPLRRFSPEAVARLSAAPWPGNVRELKNMVERLMILSPEPEIGLADLPLELSGPAADAGEQGEQSPFSYDGLSLRAARERFETDHIQRILNACGGNISRAADQLGVERSNLSKKIRQLGIEPGNHQG